MEHITVKLDDFEGPFDLLFHLIKKNKMDVRDIQVSVLTDQYMRYIYAAGASDMDNMSEFLLMAATLLELKCRLLLPLPAGSEEEDPRLFLMEMLAEYKRYREAAEGLAVFAGDASLRVFKEREDSLFELYENERLDDYGVPLSGLSEAFAALMKNKRPTRDRARVEPGVVGREAVSVGRKMEHIRRTLKIRRRATLSAFFAEAGSRDEMAAIFQGALLLVKENAVRAAQERLFGEVYLTAGDNI